MEQKEMVVDLENLKKEDFLEMAQYIQHLEGLLDAAIEKEREIKAIAVTLSTQRNQEHERYLHYKALYDRTQIGVVNVEATKATLNVYSELQNPEQYREKKQF
jgi:hypothetical protein